MGTHAKIACLATLALMLCTGGMKAVGQEKIGGTVEFDHLVHDFGDVLISDGALKCEFKMQNISTKPVVIYSVTTTCGCTDVKWSREPVQPGKSTTISATYTNDEGPYPFDKALTVHVSGLNKPVILRMRGVSRNQEEPLSVKFPVHIGNLGIKSTELKCGNLDMGGSKSEEVQVANLGNSPLNVTFRNPSEGLSMKVFPNPIPAQGIATLQFRVDAVEGLWGKNWYSATPVINGSAQDELKVFAFTRANFDNLSPEQRKKGANPMFNSTNSPFGKVKAGTEVTAEWELTNIGRETFKVYKVDIDIAGATHTPFPEVRPGGKGNFSVSVDTSGMPKGEALVLITLTTNSPFRPLVILYMTGWIE